MPNDVLPSFWSASQPFWKISALHEQSLSSLYFTHYTGLESTFSLTHVEMFIFLAITCVDWFNALYLLTVICIEN